MRIMLMTVFATVALTLPTQAQVTDSLYIVTYTTGPSWDVNKPSHEQPYFKEHSARLGQLRKEGVIRFGARYGEKGMIVITASTREAARKIIFEDQAVANKLFEVEVQKLNIFYDGCLERKKG